MRKTYFTFHFSLFFREGVTFFLPMLLVPTQKRRVPSWRGVVDMIQERVSLALPPAQGKVVDTATTRVSSGNPVAGVGILL